METFGEVLNSGQYSEKKTVFSDQSQLAEGKPGTRTAQL